MLGRKQVLARAKRIGVADFGVVGDVSAALVAVLDGELSRLVPPARTELNDLAGADPSGLVLTVTLYEILEDPTSRNRPPVRESNGETIVTRKPPMALLLRYLLTPWGGDQATVQRMVGRAMQVLYDDAILDGLQLLGGLRGSRDTLKLTLAQLRSGPECGGRSKSPIGCRSTTRSGSSTWTR